MLVLRPEDVLSGTLGTTFTAITTRFSQRGEYRHASPTDYEAEMEQP